MTSTQKRADELSYILSDIRYLLRQVHLKSHTHIFCLILFFIFFVKMSKLATLEETSIKGVYKYLLSLLLPFTSNSPELDLSRDHAVTTIRELLTNIGVKRSGIPLAITRDHRESLWKQYQADASKINNYLIYVVILLTVPFYNFRQGNSTPP